MYVCMYVCVCVYVYMYDFFANMIYSEAIFSSVFLSAAIYKSACFLHLIQGHFLNLFKKHFPTNLINTFISNSYIWSIN